MLIEEEILLKDNYKIPVGFCPKCNAHIVYSDDGTDKNNIEVVCVDSNYKGKTIMCRRCKSMLIVREKRTIISSWFAKAKA